MDIVDWVGEIQESNRWINKIENGDKWCGNDSVNIINSAKLYFVS